MYVVLYTFNIINIIADVIMAPMSAQEVALFIAFVIYRRMAPFGFEGVDKTQEMLDIQSFRRGIIHALRWRRARVHFTNTVICLRTILKASAQSEGGITPPKV